jgi:hypothetical protein
MPAVTIFMYRILDRSGAESTRVSLARQLCFDIERAPSFFFDVHHSLDLRSISAIPYLGESKSNRNYLYLESTC